MDIPETEGRGALRSPRMVFLAACDAIAEKRGVEPQGFRYSGAAVIAEGPRATSHSRSASIRAVQNVAGERVSPERDRHSLLSQDQEVAEVDIPRSTRNLRRRGPGRQLAGRPPLDRLGARRPLESRGAAIDDAVATIRSLALPYFARFEESKSLRESLARADLPSLDLPRTIEFLLSFADPTNARRAAVRFLETSPGLWPEYDQEMRRAAGEGVRPARRAGPPISPSRRTPSASGCSRGERPKASNRFARWPLTRGARPRSRPREPRRAATGRGTRC